MKLRNKRSWKFKDICYSPAALNDENSRKIWCITGIGKPVQIVSESDGFKQAIEAIGNWFETEEEAEKAVEKLMAITRLQNKGFSFDGYDVAHNSNGNLCGQIFYNAGNYCIEDVEKDLDLLFGGVE